MQTKRETQLFLCSAHTRRFAYNAHGVLVFYRGEVEALWQCALHLELNWSHRGSNKLESITRAPPGNADASLHCPAPAECHSLHGIFGSAEGCSSDWDLGGRLIFFWCLNYLLSHYRLVLYKLFEGGGCIWGCRCFFFFSFFCFSWKKNTSSNKLVV